MFSKTWALPRRTSPSYGDHLAQEGFPQLFHQVKSIPIKSIVIVDTKKNH
jgi:hypothetical protein